MRNPLQQAVAVRDVVKAEDGHKQEGEPQASVADGMAEVGFPALDGVLENIFIFVIAILIIPFLGSVVFTTFLGSAKFWMLPVDEDQEEILETDADKIPSGNEDAGADVADVGEEEAARGGGEHVGGQLDGAEDGVHLGQLVRVLGSDDHDPVLLDDDVDPRGCQSGDGGQDDGENADENNRGVKISFIYFRFISYKSGQNEGAQRHAAVLDDEEGLGSRESLCSVNPLAERGSEHDDGGGDDEAVDGREPEVGLPEVEHEDAAGEPPHVVAPGAERVGGVHPPRHLVLGTGLPVVIIIDKDDIDFLLLILAVFRFRMINILHDVID